MSLSRASLLGAVILAFPLVAGCSSSASDSPGHGPVAPPGDASTDGSSPALDAGGDVNAGDSAASQVDQASVARDPASSIPASTLDAAVAANNAFAFDLYAQVIAGAGSANVLTSPLSASLALTMTYAGAAGGTATEMATVLHADLPDGGSIFDGQNALDQALTGRGAAAFAQAQQASSGPAAAPEASDYVLQIANSVWGEETYPWASGYLSTLAKSYGTGIYLTDFVGAPAAAETAINGWVSDQTGGKIADLLPPGAVTSATAMVLVNALHVKLPWATAFETAATQTGTFTRGDGSTVSPSFMNSIGSLPYTDDGQAQIVELPLYGGQEALLVAVPHAGTTLATYEATLTATTPLAQPHANMEVGLSIPKLALSGASFPLTTELQALGMVQAFEPGTANFTGMCPPPEGDNLYIGFVLQQTTLSMQESGLEAAAATAVGIVGSAAPVAQVTMTVDRPYVIALVDVPTGAILMLGHVEDPTAP